MNAENVRELNSLNNKSFKRIILNNNFICEFITPSTVDKDSTYHFFTEWYKEKNCPRVSQYADVVVREFQTYDKHIGRVYIHEDLDLKTYSMSLCLKGEYDKKWTSMITVIHCLIDDSLYSVTEFMKLIKFKPLFPVKEPYDALGVTICQFKEHNMHYPNIEFGLDGNLYYEIVDEREYKEGDIIPLNSDKRIDVINYAKLNRDTAQSLADKINASLTRLYAS